MEKKKQTRTATEPRFMTRIPATLHKQVKRLAKDDHISMNTFIIKALEERCNSIANKKLQ